MDDHDPLCLMPRCLAHHLPYCDSTDCICQCELIAQVRADERRKTTGILLDEGNHTTIIGVIPKYVLPPDPGAKYSIHQIDAANETTARDKAANQAHAFIYTLRDDIIGPLAEAFANDLSRSIKGQEPKYEWDKITRELREWMQ